MNVISRGIRNAFRNVIRTGSIVVILGLSIGLIIAMLAARQAVSDKITTIKASSGNTITVSPAGVRGFEGGGEALTATQLDGVAKVDHVSSIVRALSDRMTTTQTNLVSSIEPGSFGNRQANNSGVAIAPPAGESAAPTDSSTGTTTQTTRTFTPPVTINGVDAVSGIASGSSLTWKSGQAFSPTADVNEAVLGTAIATKNKLSVGSTFQAYGTTITVVGIYDAGNTFSNNGIDVSLITLQRLSSQPGSITSAIVNVDSSDNIAATTTAIKTLLGDKADVTNSQATADALTQPLESVKQISLFSLIGAVAAGAVIILLTMIMIVRERRREVGVMKAIGASNVTIMWQFIIEATTLTVLGLVVGVLIGVTAATPLTTMLVDTNTSTASTTTGRPAGGPGMRNFGQTSAQTLKNIQSSVGVGTLSYGIGAALLIAVLGSAVPSLLISRIKPAEAMRSE